MVKIKLGGVTVCLREPQDLGWLLELGAPFAVFDQNDSGNLSFGVERAGKKFFVKYAGARTLGFSGDPAEAVAALRRAETVYRDLAYPALIPLLDAVETPQGFALLFPWVEGECLHAHWTFDERPKLTHPQSPYVRFRALPLEEKRAAARILFDFLACAQQRGYVAVDLYDGTLLYDFARRRLTLCDVDLFAKGPLVNATGTWWGSRRMMPPEELEIGGIIDFSSNVFTLGRLLLSLFAGEDHPDRDHWEDTEGRWAAVLRATQPEKSRRFPTVQDFWQCWQAAGPEEPASDETGR